MNRGPVPDPADGCDCDTVVAYSASRHFAVCGPGSDGSILRGVYGNYYYGRWAACYVECARRSYDSLLDYCVHEDCLAKGHCHIVKVRHVDSDRFAATNGRAVHDSENTIWNL